MLILWGQKCEYQLLNSSDEETLDKIFKEVDKEGSNELSNDEVSQLCVMFGQTCSEAEINQAIKKADNDGDGKVSLGEFKAEILSSLVCSLRNTTKILISHITCGPSMME